ncbi:LacI family DNA-binding transcriptional regulator [Echinicola rosea]|uniref:LacI family transcriptional regulator n=1 Tax=Echinicola rosea TaxID=1807691 RepID=A0ABQ1UUG0_9BACT|nr:substrate-binding domain-containing protein [Echinicola rosea]GGF25368.1 LacI family transcriptional regulator [Echinicola rosea]
MKKTSLKDIAKVVGVSTAAVSYVLSKGEENRVSPKVAEKIKKVAKELSYQPNQIAKSLKMGKTFTIGLIVADISNPFFANIARIIEDEAKHLNYTVIFGSSDESVDKSEDLINFFINRQVDGFIITPVEGSEKQIERLKELNIPYVLIDRFFPNIPSSYVVIDNYQAAYKGVHKLIENGHERIGILSYSNGLVHMKERVRGYRQAMEYNKLKIERNWIREISYEEAEKDVKSALDVLFGKRKEVDALFFATNTIAVMALKYIDSLKLHVPNDVAIVSFDQGEAFDFYYCPLTYIKQPLSSLAKGAVNILINQINMGNRGVSQTSLEADLIIGKSSD